MFGSKMKWISAGVFAAALSLGLANTTSAQPPVVIGGGLVNVQIVDVIDDIIVDIDDINVNVGVALQVAANVCGVAVGVIAEDLADGNAACDAVVDGTGQFVTINR